MDASQTPQPHPPRTIAGTTYVGTPLPATKGLHVLTRLTRLVGEAALVIAARGRKALDDLPPDVLTYTIETMLGKLTEAEVEQTIKELLAGVYVHGEPQPVSASFDSHFRGRMAALFQVVQYALEVNYRDFFDAVRSLNIAQTIPGPDATEE